MGNATGAVHVRTVMICVAFLLPACNSNQRYAQLLRENQNLREDKVRAEDAAKICDKELASARSQAQQMQTLGPDRPVDLFAPVSVEIVSLSGGADYDNKPGDDGVTVHLRPKDADGQVVKVPGKITIQLLDNTNMAEPKVIAVCEHEKPEDIHQLWMGIFGTNHYTIRCPFPEGASLPASRKLLVNAAFVDFLTGRTLTASKEVTFSPAH
jgi:hypothetical protein